MLKNENIVCISSIDWDFIWQGHQEIMSAFAKNGNKVLFIENTGARMPGIRDTARVKNRLKNWFKGIKGIRKERENLYIFSPIALPFPYSRFALLLNHRLVYSILDRWIKIMNFSDPIVIVFLPTPLSLDIINSMAKKAVIYYCIDNFSVSSAFAKKIKKSEIKLLKKVDLVFVTSKALHDYCSKYNASVYRFPFGVNFEQFQKARMETGSVSKELVNIKKPIIGYVGGVHKWIDQGLIKDLAGKNPDYSFVFVGPLQVDVSCLTCLNNVYFLGNKKHNELPVFIKYFDVCIIPYVITEYTKNVYPTKLNEYFAMGKPVVSTALPEVIGFNDMHKSAESVYIAKDSASFSECVKKAILQDNPEAADRRAQIAMQNSWKQRIEDMSGLIEAEIERKRLDRDIKWKEYLLIFYKKAGRRTVKLAIACFLLYTLIFKTSFVWFAASPLKISDYPSKSDAVVVFGGGVGETGSPGKSTIERARYAAQLYREGYAKKIVFSSGYTYSSNDAENMRLLALSMGVADKDIILEDKANKTYENVIYTKQIAEKNRWNSILLVSSPYNMRRAELVFKKHAKDIKVVYTPVEKSEFYNHANAANLDQIKAITHEYLGIIYYLLKGYI